MTSAPQTTVPQRALLAGAIDYAGLFAPAELDMRSAVSNYLAYRASPDAWALGRFMVPVSRLEEFSLVLREVSSANTQWVSLGAQFGSRTADDVAAIEAFNHESSIHRARVESVEAKAGSDAMVRALLAGIPPSWSRYLELPLAGSNEAALDAVAAGHAFAKIRTGGVTAEAFPEPDDLVRFLAAAAKRRLPFKATAGLHHPLRGSYRLTYAGNSASGVMYGYLNLIIAAAVAWAGGAAAQVRSALLETEASALRFERGALVWRDFRVQTAFLVALRASFLHGIGSCSFREPVDELVALEAG